jgi:hypothetical protein
VAHPGLSFTNLFQSTDGMGANPVIRHGGRVMCRVLFQPPAAGAVPTLYAATAAAPGSYSGPAGPGELRGRRAGPARIRLVGQDGQLAAQLWDLSEELTGVHYDWPGGSS